MTARNKLFGCSHRLLPFPPSSLFHPAVFSPSLFAHTMSALCFLFMSGLFGMLVCFDRMIPKTAVVLVGVVVYTCTREKEKNVPFRTTL